MIRLSAQYKVATLIFGLFHDFGLATKILEYEVSPDGLIPNLIAFVMVTLRTSGDYQDLQEVK